MTEPAARKHHRFYTDEHWSEIGDFKFHMLWFQYLRISPSYELARKQRTGKLAERDVARLPADFETVLAVFDDLGDVQQVGFEKWWMETGIRFFGNEGKRLSVAPLAVMSDELTEPLSSVGYQLNEYINGLWNKQGRPATAVMSIPLGLTKTQIMMQLDFILTKYESELRIPPASTAKYPVVEGKKDLESLFKYMKCLVIKAHEPQLPLHVIGAAAELSSTYSERILDGEGSIDDRDALKVLTSRGMDRGLMLAENAARGIFPSYAKCKHAVTPDWEELSDLLDSQVE